MFEIKKIAFLGIGLMGLPMARNLLKSGFVLRAWNRSQEKTVPLIEYGAETAKHLSDAVMGADLIVSMLSDGSVVRQLLDNDEFKNSLVAGMVWVDMSSTRPDEAKTLSKLLHDFGVQFLDAPVSGGTKGAEDATLAIMVGASEKDFELTSPVLECLGRPVHVGPVGSGQLAKLANQLIVASTIGAVAEAMLLLETGGANPDAVRDALSGGFADSTILQQHGKRMVQRNFTPGGLSRLQLKDLENILAQAEVNNLKLPMAEQMRDRFERYVNELDGAEKDHSGIFEELWDINS